MNAITLDRSEEVNQLPGVLGGTKTAFDWETKRRPEILKILETNLFGKFPARPQGIEFQELRRRVVFQGKALRREIEIRLSGLGQVQTASALWYTPLNCESSAVICGLNFKGNAGCTLEEDLPLGKAQIRGEHARRWPFEQLIDAGISVITACYHDFYPDRAGGRAESIYRLLYPASELGEGNRSLTAIGAWGRGYSILRELAETDPRTGNIWAHGHSRLGKTALWAGAHDPRFFGIISNDSGCCGAAISREKQGERYDDITRMFPHWLVPEADAYAFRENELPFDQHFLLSMMVPRPLMVCSASEDLWADPFNEYRSLKAVGEVYRLFGAHGIGSSRFPELESPIMGDSAAYYVRRGKHDVLAFDWEMVTSFVKKFSK